MALFYSTPYKTHLSSTTNSRAPHPVAHIAAPCKVRSGNNGAMQEVKRNGRSLRSSSSPPFS